MSLSARAARSQAKPSGFGIFVRILLEHLKLKKAWPSSPSVFLALHEHVKFDGQFFDGQFFVFFPVSVACVFGPDCAFIALD